MTALLYSYNCVKFKQILQLNYYNENEKLHLTLLSKSSLSSLLQSDFVMYKVVKETAKSNWRKSFNSMTFQERRSRQSQTFRDDENISIFDISAGIFDLRNLTHPDHQGRWRARDKRLTSCLLKYIIAPSLSERINFRLRNWPLSRPRFHRNPSR